MAGFDLGLLFLSLAAIVAGAGAARLLFRRFGLPGVVGEILFGVATGPSLLGWLSPSTHTPLFPTATSGILEAFSWVGLALFVFFVGLDMEWGQARPRTVGLVALGGLAFPLAAGVLLATWHPDWFFALAPTPSAPILVGVALTVSALPVLARILQDLDLLRDPVGIVSIGAATIDDIAGWLLMAVLVGSGVHASFGLQMVAVVALAITLAFAARTLARRPMSHKPASAAFVPIIAAVFAAAWVTHAAGINAVLGPLAVGAAVSRVPALREAVRERLGDLTRAILLPVFFVVSGASVDFRLLLDGPGLASLALVTVVASAAKVAGCYAGARASGLDARRGLATGLLLNARGAVGLVVAKVGLDAGVFSVRGYSLLVMVVALTTLGAPVLSKMALKGRPAETSLSA